MYKTTATKTKRVRFVVIAAIMVALMLIPIIGLAAGRDNGVQAGLPLTTTSDTQTKSSHMLEWGVFGIALGEFAGILGMGMSKARVKRKVAQKQPLVPTANMPMALQPNLAAITMGENSYVA